MSCVALRRALCVLTTIPAVMAVSLQLCGAGTALLHTLHCTLHLCRWQTLTLCRLRVSRNT